MYNRTEVQALRVYLLGGGREEAEEVGMITLWCGPQAVQRSREEEHSLHGGL